MYGNRTVKLPKDVVGIVATYMYVWCPTVQLVRSTLALYCVGYYPSASILDTGYA